MDEFDNKLKVKDGRVELATEDLHLIAVYKPCDMGAKGRIGVMIDKRENAFDLMANGIPCFIAGGNYYKAVEFPLDYPELMSRFYWYTTSKASAYSD